MKRYLVFLLAVASIVIAFSSCKKDNSLDLLRSEEVRMLAEFMENYFPEEEPTSSGMYYIKTHEGYGDSIIKPGDEVHIWYTGRFLSDSTIFDATTDEDGHQYMPLEFVVGSSDIIQGMSEGVSNMRLGEKAILIIPSNLAYGATNNYDSYVPIPRFSTLIFDVEIYKHKRLDSQ